MAISKNSFSHNLYHDFVQRPFSYLFLALNLSAIASFGYLIMEDYIVERGVYSGKLISDFQGFTSISTHGTTGVTLEHVVKEDSSQHISFKDFDRNSP